MLGKANRLNKHGSFAYVYKKGKRVSSADLALIFTPARSVRVGFSVSNKVGKAVVRNKAKRRLRSAVREMLPKLIGCQAIVVAKPTAAGKSFEELSAQLITLFKKAELYYDRKD